MTGFRERRISAQDGLPIYCRDYGEPRDAPLPVLCLTGITRNSSDYHGLARRLAGRRRVVCPDYRGHGRSGYDGNWRNYAPQSYAADMLSLLVALGVPRCVIVGTSMGGLLAMGMAALRPGAVAAVVLNDIGPDPAPGAVDKIIDFISVDRPQPSLAAAAQMLRGSQLPQPRRTEADWLALAVRTFRLGEDGRYHIDWDPAIAEPLRGDPAAGQDLWALYGAIRRLPALAIRGELSDLLAPATFDRMAAVKPDLRRVTVAGVAHPPYLDEPEAWEAIDDFLAGV